MGKRKGRHLHAVRRLKQRKNDCKKGVGKTLRQVFLGSWESVSKKKKGVARATPFLPAFAEIPEHTPIQ